MVRCSPTSASEILYDIHTLRILQTIVNHRSRPMLFIQDPKGQESANVRSAQCRDWKRGWIRVDKTKDDLFVPTKKGVLNVV